MRKITSLTIITCFFVYWISTFLFTMPENYFRINFQNADAIFQSTLFQRWSFFAPPPQHNDKLYYIIRNKESQTVTHVVEVLEYISSQKHSNAPFNQEETVIDYILSNSVNGLRSSYIEQMEILRYITPDSTESYYSKKSLDHILETKHQFNDFTTLTNYAKIICRKNDIEMDNAEFKLMIVQKPIAKFKDRQLLNSATEKEHIVFETPYTAF